MFNTVTYEEILEGQGFDRPIFIDLRSEEEYKKETIPGAINVPILNDQDRKIVGTLYKNTSVQEAKKYGVGLVSKKLPFIYDFITAKTHQGQVILFCSRGGYRSTVIFEFLRSLDNRVYKLDHGYKAYRTYIRENLEDSLLSFNYINLNGMTGTGKTEILDHLKPRANVLDFEGLANHKGSLFGSVGLDKQPSQKMFESLIFNAIKNFSGKEVFVESESTKIGKLSIFKSVHNAYGGSENQVLVRDSLESRIARIKKDYLRGDLDLLDIEISSALVRLKKYISKDLLTKCNNLLNKRNYDELISLLIVNYYDKTYKKDRKDFDLIIDNKDSKKSAKIIYEFYEKKYARAFSYTH